MKTTNECRVELIDSMGNDLTVVNSARVSFDKESNWENSEWGHPDFEEPDRLAERDTKLINYLARHNHWTPFAHCMVTLRETVPIFVARQRFKHMVGFTYNEVSRRYVDDEPEFFVPDEWRGKPENAKQGSSGPIKAQFFSKTAAEDVIAIALEAYEDLLDEGVCPEQARMVLPQNMMTSYYVTGSLAAWARAYKQRIDPHAQVEIQDLAHKWGEIISPLFPVSWEALTQ